LEGGISPPAAATAAAEATALTNTEKQKNKFSNIYIF
jgi:hypothetical protein